MEPENDLISIRIGREIKKILKKESQMKSLTLNKLINQVLTEYVKFDMPFKKMNVIYVPKSYYKALIAEIDADKIKQISATEGISAFKSFSLLTNSNLNLETLLESLKLWLTANTISYNYDKNESYHILSVHHCLGKNFALSFHATVSTMIEEIGHRIDLRHMDENNLTITINDAAN